MENKNVGYLILGIAVVFIILIYMYQRTLTGFVDSSCTLAHGGNYCPMYDTISQQTYLSLGIVGVLIIIGLILVFSKPYEKVILKTRTIEKKKKGRKIDTSSLNKEEKDVLEIVMENKTIFQADLIEKTGFGKAKITRVLDRLEGKGIIERKRRGMTNVVVLKED